MERTIIEGTKLKPMIIYVPDNTISMRLEVKIIDEDENIHKAEQKLELPTIIDHLIEGYEWESENARFYVCDNYDTNDK